MVCYVKFLSYATFYIFSKKRRLQNLIKGSRVESIKDSDHNSLQEKNENILFPQTYALLFPNYIGELFIYNGFLCLLK